MVSSPQANDIFDFVRKKWVRCTPEEKIRQGVILHLVEKLGYPKDLIMIEKALSEIPHLKYTFLPQRRIDILCYDKIKHSPLLIIECKAVSLSQRMMAQVSGYNMFVKAPLMCLVNKNRCVLQWEDNSRNMGYTDIPTYKTLVEDVYR